MSPWLCPISIMLGSYFTISQLQVRNGSQAGAAAAPSQPPSSAALTPALTSTALAASSGPSTGAAQPRSHGAYKSTTLIPGWSRALSSQQLQIECQKVNQLPLLRSTGARDGLAVLEMEVMKFVAYCGGVTLEFRMDECSPEALNTVTWGLASTRACPALQNLHAVEPQQQDGAVAAGDSSSSMLSPRSSLGSTNGRPDSSGAAAATSGAASQPLGCRAVAGATVQVDSISRKPMHMICTTSQPQALSASDVISIDLAPREDRQPVILATLRHNNTVVLQQALPCSTISSLQLYPFVTLQPGMTVSLHRALTPSPLFTWYLGSPGAAAANDAHFAELDTCVRFASPAAAAAPAPPPPTAGAIPLPGVATELLGSVSFSTGRHRWTVQLDNYNSTPTHIFVGVASAGLSGEQGGSGTSGGAFRSIPSSASLASSLGAAAGFAATAVPPHAEQEASVVAQPPGPEAEASSSSAAVTDVSASSSWLPVVPPSRPGSFGSLAAAAAATPQKWGAWIKLPGALGRGGGGGQDMDKVARHVPPGFGDNRRRA